MNYTEKKDFLQYKQKKINYFFNKSLSSSNKVLDYTSKLSILNKKTGEFFPIKYDFEKIQKNNGLWYNFVSTYIQNKAIVDGKKAVFITVTLPTKFHPFTTLKNKSHIRNKNFDNSFDGSILLNDFFRHLYNTFRIHRKHIKLNYLKVIEPHKDFTPHLHAVIYLEQEHLDFFKNHFNNSLKLFGMGVQFDFTPLNDTQSSVTYISKYVSKSINSDNLLNSRIIDGWKKSHKIRMFTHSYVPVSRDVYKVVSRFVDLKSSETYNIFTQKIDGYSILENLENKIHLTQNYYDDKNNLYKTKEFFNVNADYKVFVSKQKRKKIDISILLNLSYLYKTRFDYYKFFDDLTKLDFDFSHLHSYYFDKFVNANESLYFISKNYDYKEFFIRFNFSDFIELFQNFLTDEANKFNSSYSIIEFIILHNDVEIYNKTDFDLI